MVSRSLVLRYVIVFNFLILLNSKDTFSLRVMRSPAKVAQIGADDYPSSGRSSPVHDLGYPEFPSFQEAVAPPPPPPDMPFLPPPAFTDPERPRFPVPAWPTLPDFPPFPFVDQAAPSEPFAPRFDESDSWMPSTPSNPQGFP